MHKWTALVLTLSLVGLSTIRCDTASYLSETVSLQISNIHASAVLKNVSIHRANNAQFVHADLTVASADKKLRGANLDCFALTIKNQISARIYVDSIASVLSDPYPADAEGRIQAAVYWTFPGTASLDSRDFTTARLVMTSKEASCFHYQPRSRP